MRVEIIGDLQNDEAVGQNIGNGGVSENLRILITSFSCATRTGVEVYVRDLAVALQMRGHVPVIYSPCLGELARELRSLAILVVDDLSEVGATPDLIHGQHHLETMMALLHFPGVPAIYFSHNALSWLDSPPLFPRVLRCVAVDQDCYDKLVVQQGVPEERVRLLLNFVNLERFTPREALPAKPQRALLYSSYTKDDAYLTAVREACSHTGLRLDTVGLSMGTSSRAPEKLLGQYDIVFAKGRSALEALAVGTAVVIYCMTSVGPMVTASELDRLLPLNFGLRAMRCSLSTANLTQELIAEIGRYDARDAAQVSARVRELSNEDTAIDEIISLYGEVIEEFRGPHKSGIEAEGRAAAAYIRWLANCQQEKLDELNNSIAIRLKRRVVSVPVMGKLAHSLARRLAGLS
jgi:Glycosyltransferase Family 4